MLLLPAHPTALHILVVTAGTPRTLYRGEPLDPPYSTTRVLPIRADSPLPAEPVTEA